MKEKKDINVQIGAQIKAAREAAGMTQERFAELVPLGTKNVSDIERGVVGISISVLKRICEVLSVSSDVILFGGVPDDDAEFVADRLKVLPPTQYKIALEAINKLFEAFASADQA